jgi:formate dehydrogenase maturation protein FdhE
MVKKLTKKQKKAYLEASCICPFCGSRDIEGDHIEVDGQTAWQPITCNFCNKRWHDIYKLVDVEAVE